MNTKKITLVKIPGFPSLTELSEWNQKIVDGEICLYCKSSIDKLRKQNIEVEKIAITDDASYLTLVKVGSDDYRPTPLDLEDWRMVFEQAANNPDFKIITHDKVTIERIKIDRSATVITGAAEVII